MAIKGGDPILERQNWSTWFFGLCAFLFFCYGASIYQEFISRRTYIHYQREFQSYETGKVKAERDAFTKSYDGAKEKELAAQVEAAKKKKESAEYEKLQDDRNEVFFELGFRKSERAKAKSNQDAQFYNWKNALHEGEAEGEVKEQQDEYWKIEKGIEEKTAKVVEEEKKLSEIDTKIAAYDNAVKDAEKALEAHRAPVAAFDERLEKIDARSIRTIDQIVNDRLGIGGAYTFGTVDRCRSCHVAVDRPGFENAERVVFKTHPKIDPLFTNHPIETYGCTVCHGGQGRATRIKHGVFDSPDAKDKDGHPKYTFADQKDQAHGTMHHWEEPLLRGDFLQSNCNRCHSLQRWVNEAPVYEKGKNLFLVKGCAGCHAVKGHTETPRVGPSLTRVKSKLTPEFLVSWIQNPKAFYPETRMPAYVFDEYQVGAEDPKDNIAIMEKKEQQADVATKIAAFLWQSSSPERALPFGKYPGGGNAAEGLQVIETVGCLACHNVGGKGLASAPPLYKAGAKMASEDWIWNWVRNPRWHSEVTIMPSLRLSDDEAKDVTAWLWAAGQKDRFKADAVLAKKLEDPALAKDGSRLITQWGCAGCHVINQHEKDGRIGPENTLFGEKKPFELGFGDSHVPETWLDWTAGKITNPRQYVDVRSAARMPWFGLKEDEVHALTVYLKGLKEPKVAKDLQKQFVGRNAQIERGRLLVNHYNCVGCHLIEGRGGDILAVVKKDRTLSPPNLNAEGLKIQADYIRDFLKAPGVIRPWLKIRMPTFPLTDAERADIVTYFRAVDGIDGAYDDVDLAKLDAKLVDQGEGLFKTYACQSCHIFKGQRTAAATDEKVAPDLANVSKRFRPDGVEAWLAAPQKVMPGTNMPGFFYDYDPKTGKLDPIAKNPEEEIDAIRSYLFSVGKGSGQLSQR